MATATMKIDDLANWSEPRRVETKNGPRMLRTAPAGDDFWAAWKSSKQELKDAGVSCGKNRQTGAWEACWWLPLGDAEQQKLDDALEASRAVDAAIDVPAPDGLAYLPYQRAGIAYALSRPSTLIGDEMGLGKTIQAIGVHNADAAINKTLIVCPASLRLNWKREFEKWATRDVTVAVVNGGGVKAFPKGHFDVLIVNYDVLAKHRDQIDAVEWDLLIADEVHYARNPESARSRALFGHVTRKGEVKRLPIKSRRRLLLTGTPIENRTKDLWPIVNACDPAGLGKNFFAFAKKYCGAHHNGYGWEFNGSSNVETLARLLRERFMVRRLKSEVLTELPAKIRQIVELPANGASEVVANEMAIFERHEAYIAELERRLDDVEYYGECDDDPQYGEFAAEIRREIAKAKKIAFEDMARFRIETAKAKAPKVAEAIKSELESVENVVVFAWHKCVIETLKEELKEFGVAVITGETSMHDRQQAVDDFQAGRVRVFLGNMLAAGVGITLTRSSNVRFVELPWLPGQLSQAEDRCHRIGQQDSVLVKHYVLEDSVDEIMAKQLIAKQEVITATLDTRHDTTTDDAATTFTRREIAEKVITVKPDPKQIESEKLTDTQIAAIHDGLRRLAGVCDGAHELDGCGFNKFDSRYGKSLAATPELTRRQALTGKNMCIKYRRQLGDDAIATIKGK